MAINILQELNLGAAKASFSRDEVETLSDIKNLDVAKKYPNNYDIFCKEDGCKYRLNKTSHSTMQDNLPHPTGKWRRVDSVISSSMPAPITTGDVVLYLGPTVMDQVDHTKVKFQTGKYYRTEYTKVNKQMYAFVQNTAPDTPDTSPNPAVIWFSETSTLSEGSVLFTPVNGSIFDNKEHGIIMTSDWDGESAISGSSYEYLDNSNSAKLGMVRNSNFDTAFDSFPELTWNMFDTEAELENIKQNVIPEAISSATEEIKTEVKTEVKEDVDANLGQAKKLNDILTDGDIKLLKQGGIEKLVSSKPDATVSDSTIGFVQCDCNRNEETGEVTLNITNVKYGPFTSEEIAENAFVDENEIIVPSQMQFPAYAITCSVTNKAKDAIFTALKDSNLYKGTLGFDAVGFISRLQEGLPLVVGFAVAAPYKDDEHTGSVDSSTYVSMYNLFENIDAQSPVNFTPIPVSEIPDIKNRTVELLEKETVLDLILYVVCPEGLESQLASSNVLELLNEQFVIGTEASGILNEFPTMRKEIEDSIAGEFSNVKKLNDSLNEEDVDTIVSRPRESIFDAKSPYIPYGNKLLTECTFVKLEFDENGVATITDSATVSDAISLDNPPEWIHEGHFAILFGIMQKGSNVGYRYTDTDVYNCSFKVDYDRPDVDINRKPENMFGINSVYFAVGNNGDERGDIKADFTACKFTDIDTYADGTEDVDGRHLMGDLIGDYEDDGTPITLRNYSKSDYTVLYGIALFTSSGNVISEADYTAKNIVASINKRVIPMYQESGLLIDFPKMEEQFASVKEMADEFGTVKQNANKAMELALPAETKEYIKKNIFENIAIDLVPVSNNFDANKYTHIVGLNGNKVGGIYYPMDSSRTITPRFFNYFDSSVTPYSANTSEMMMRTVSTSSTYRYIGVLGSIKCGKNTDLLNNLKGMAVSFDPEKFLIKNNNTYFSIVDIYINTSIAVSNYADEINDVDASYWTRLNPGDSLYDIFKNKSTYYYGDGNIQFIFVVRGFYGDDSFRDCSPVEANIEEILTLASITKSLLDDMKTKIDSMDIDTLNDDISALEERTSAIETKLEPLTDGISALSDATKSIIQKYPIKLATFYDAKFNGALKINADTYDPETTTSVSLSFYNYFDSSKKDYRNPANPATPMLVEDKFVAVAAYIDIPEVLGIPPYSSAAQLKEYCKNISVRFDRTQSIKVDLQNNNNTSVYSGANVFIRDVYFKANSITQAPALASYTYSTKITNSNPIAELVDASYSPGFIPIFIFILEVIPDTNYSVPLKNYLAQQNFAKFINSLCEISFNKVRDAEDKAQEAQEAIENMSSVTDDISALESKVAKSNKLADRFTDAEMDKLFKKISEKIISSVNGVNDVDFRICACASSDNWATATITKYMEAPLSGDLTDYHIALPGAYGNTFDTIAVSCGISFGNGATADGMPAYEVMSKKAIYTWLDASLLNPVAIYTAQTFTSSSFDKSTYYRTRVKDGGPSGATINYRDMEPLKSNAYESDARIHFLVFIQVNSNTTAEDLNAANLFELAKKAIVPVGVTSGIVSEYDTVKQNVNSAQQAADNAIEMALPGKTKEYIKNKLYDIKTAELHRATASESQGTAYDNTNCNGLISIGSSYDHQDESRSISVTFKNYFDSSKSDYVSASEVIAIKDAAVWYQKTNYIAIPVTIKGYGGRTKESILESLKGVIVSKSSSAYMIKKKTSYGSRPYGKLVDVYGGLTSDQYGAAHLNLLSFASLSRANESTFSVAELLSDAVEGGSYYQTPCLILVYDVYYGDSPEISPDIITELDTEDLVNNTFSIYTIPTENRIDQLEQKFDGVETAISSISSAAASIDNISDSMSDYMSAKWLPTPIAFPDRALENEQEPSGNSKDFDFLLYPTFVDAPHSEGSYVEGKNSSYSVKSIPDSGNISVKALYESEKSMYLLFGFFGEKLLPESLGGDYTIPETYNENTIESFNRVSKTFWYSDIYMNMQNTFIPSMIKGIRDSLVEIDVSNIFLNFNPRAIKSLYAKVTADPGNELTHSSYTNRGLNNMEDFVKIPYANIQDTNTISMEDIVNMCGRPDKTKTSGSSKAVILFVAEIDKSWFTDLASLTTPAYGVSNTTSDILAIYQAMFANNSESSPIYMARSIDDSLKKTKEVAVEAARYAAATLTAAKHYDTLADLKLLINKGESGYIVRNGETEGTSVADVYIKTTEGALIKIASGVEYEAPVSQ